MHIRSYGDDLATVQVTLTERSADFADPELDELGCLLRRGRKKEEIGCNHLRLKCVYVFEEEGMTRTERSRWFAYARG